MDALLSKGFIIIPILLNAIDKSPFLCLFYTYNVTIINTDLKVITRGIPIMKKTLAVLITACSLSLGLTPAFTAVPGNLVIEAEAHQGRTDKYGGHHDYNNVSGLGSYHYHCGGHQLICIQTESALMQAVPLTITSAPLAISLTPETKPLQKLLQPRFPPAGSRTITAGGTAFLQIPTMLTA